MSQNVSRQENWVECISEQLQRHSTFQDLTESTPQDSDRVRQECFSFDTKPNNNTLKKVRDMMNVFICFYNQSKI